MTTSNTKYLGKTDTYNFKVISTGKELSLKCAKEDIRTKLDKYESKKEDYVYVIVHNDTYLNELTIGIAKKEVTINESIKPKERDSISLDFTPADKIDTNFQKLNKLSCKTEKKGGFTYISWASMWKVIKTHDPNANFKVYEEESTGYPCWIKKGVGAFVKVGVTIDSTEYIEHFPVLDNNNNAMFEKGYNKEYKSKTGIVSKSEWVDAISSFDINKAHKRAMVKASAYAGFGLALYDKEDLPTEDEE